VWALLDHHGGNAVAGPSPPIVSKHAMSVPVFTVLRNPTNRRWYVHNTPGSSVSSVTGSTSATEPYLRPFSRLAATAAPSYRKTLAGLLFHLRPRRVPHSPTEPRRCRRSRSAMSINLGVQLLQGRLVLRHLPARLHQQQTPWPPIMTFAEQQTARENIKQVRYRWSALPAKQPHLQLRQLHLTLTPAYYLRHSAFVQTCRIAAIDRRVLAVSRSAIVLSRGPVGQRKNTVTGVVLPAGGFCLGHHLPRLER